MAKVTQVPPNPQPPVCNDSSHNQPPEKAKGTKKAQACGTVEALIHLIVTVVLQHIPASNHCVVHLKPTCPLSTVSVKWGESKRDTPGTMWPGARNGQPSLFEERQRKEAWRRQLQKGEVCWRGHRVSRVARVLGQQRPSEDTPAPAPSMNRQARSSGMGGRSQQVLCPGTGQARLAREVLSHHCAQREGRDRLWATQCQPK